MAKQKIADVVADLAGEFLSENGYELYNTEFVKEGRDWFLRVYIDKVQPQQTGDPDEAAQAEDADAAAEQAEEAALYISTDDCEKVSRFLSEKLDAADPIEQNYYLEVSSPGMDRPLIRPEHYERYVGSEVEIKLYKAADGVKNIRGVLESFDADSETVTVRSLDGGSGVNGGSKSKGKGKSAGSNKGSKGSDSKGKGKSAGSNKGGEDGRLYELQLADIAKANLAVVF